MAVYLIVLEIFVDGLVWFSLNFVLHVDIGNINVHTYVVLAVFLFGSVIEFVHTLDKSLGLELCNWV